MVAGTWIFWCSSLVFSQTYSGDINIFMLHPIIDNLTDNSSDVFSVFKYQITFDKKTYDIDESDFKTPCDGR